MTAKACATVLGIGLALLASASSGRADGLDRVVHKHRWAGQTFGPRSEYARVTVKALFDSCWRYRGREHEPIWTCGNYIKPNAEFDRAYGHSIADQALLYGYPW
jgi:hypothetical protein